MFGIYLGGENIFLMHDEGLQLQMELPYAEVPAQHPVQGPLHKVWEKAPGPSSSTLIY